MGDLHRLFYCQVLRCSLGLVSGVEFRVKGLGGSGFFFERFGQGWVFGRFGQARGPVVSWSLVPWSVVPWSLVPAVLWSPGPLVSRSSGHRNFKAKPGSAAKARVWGLQV